MMKCPTCGIEHTEQSWNNYTQEIVGGLNNSNKPITPMAERTEGTLFRCPSCEDEVITAKNKTLVVQITE